MNRTDATDCRCCLQSRGFGHHTSDMAVIQYARKVVHGVHISTKLNVSNIESVRFHSQFADVIVFSKELTLYSN
jgi:hypothetical protein